jgi:hypothetical protein
MVQRSIRTTRGALHRPAASEWAYSSKKPIHPELNAAPQQAWDYHGPIMALSLFAAQALVGSYLNGRQLPDALLVSIVDSVEARLKSGKLPVLDESLRGLIDREAIEPEPPVVARSTRSR